MQDDEHWAEQQKIMWIECDRKEKCPTIRPNLKIFIISLNMNFTHRLINSETTVSLSLWLPAVCLFPCCLY